MRVLVAGPRGCGHITSSDVAMMLDRLPFPVDEILHGGAIGVDSHAAVWAAVNGIPEKVIRPKYDRFENKKLAPLARNTELVEIATAAAVVWDGRSRGTRDVLSKIRKKNIPLVLHIWPAG